MSPLHIITCMKPVPDPRLWRKLALDPQTMLLRRADLPAVMNPLDRRAIHEAIALARATAGRVSVVTMAPTTAERELMEALAMGCDAAYHLSDPAFAGADTLATARCLAAAIGKIGRFDFIFTGASSLDGSTAQVGPQIAELLGIPDLTHATGIAVSGETVIARGRSDEGAVEAVVAPPALLTFAAQPEPGDLATMNGIRAALGATTVTWSAGDLGLSPDEVGLAGSPTQMLNISAARSGRKGEMLTGSAAEQVGALLGKIPLAGAPGAESVEVAR